MLTPFRSDTNSLFLTEKLNDLGVDVVFKSIVGDDRQRLVSTAKLALARSDLVIFGRAQPSHEYNQIRTREREFGGGDQALTVVANNALEDHVDTEVVQLFRQKQGVRVRAKRRKHLGPDGDNFGIHSGNMITAAGQLLRRQGKALDIP